MTHSQQLVWLPAISFCEPRLLERKHGDASSGSILAKAGDHALTVQEFLDRYAATVGGVASGGSSSDATRREILLSIVAEKPLAQDGKIQCVERKSVFAGSLDRVRRSFAMEGVR